MRSEFNDWKNNMGDTLQQRRRGVGLGFARTSSCYKSGPARSAVVQVLGDTLQQRRRGVGKGLGFSFAQTKAFKQFEQEQHLGLGFAPDAGYWRLEVMRQLQHAHNTAIEEVRVLAQRQCAHNAAIERGLTLTPNHLRDALR